MYQHQTSEKRQKVSLDTPPVLRTHGWILFLFHAAGSRIQTLGKTRRPRIGMEQSARRPAKVRRAEEVLILQRIQEDAQSAHEGQRSAIQETREVELCRGGDGDHERRWVRRRRRR